MKEPDEITGSERIIDSCDLLARCEFLEAHYESLKDDAMTAREELDAAKGKKAKAKAEAARLAADDEVNAFDGGKYLEADSEDETSDEYQEMIALREVIDEIGESPCRYGDATLIADSYFTEYCQELCADIGDVPRDLPAYLSNNINWDGVAEDLKVDYSTTTLFGNDYHYRNC